MTAAHAPALFVVDDDAGVRTCIQGLLKSARLRCTSFGTAEEYPRRQRREDAEDVDSGFFLRKIADLVLICFSKQVRTVSGTAPMLRFGKLAVVVAVLCFSALAFAQGGATGAITGTVQDASGAVISGAQVNVVNEATGQVLRKVSTDSSGTFTATLLRVGNYSLEVSAPGFATSKISGIAVRITETTRLNAVLKV